MPSGQEKYAARVKDDMRKTFGTDEGKHVLMYLYERCFGKQPTFPVDCNPFALARNEGMRMALLLIIENMAESEIEIRAEWAEHHRQKLREAESR